MRRQVDRFDAAFEVVLGIPGSLHAWKLLLRLWCLLSYQGREGGREGVLWILAFVLVREGYYRAIPVI